MHLDMSIHEPPMDAGEAEMMLFALERSRAQLAWKVSGLDAAGLAARLGSSRVTLGGLLKHLAFVENDKARWVILGLSPGDEWAAHGFDQDWPWTSAADDTPERLYARWYEAVAESRAIIAARLADGGLDRPVEHEFDGWGRPNLRRVLTDLHDEYARHVGHADLLREHVDGLVGEDPPEVPMVVAAFQHELDLRDGEAAAALCIDDVTIADDGRSYVGRDGVAEFVASAAAEFTFTRALLASEQGASDEWVIVNRVSGDFPGSPVVLHSRFALADHRIARLTIAP